MSKQYKISKIGGGELSPGSLLVGGVTMVGQHILMPSRRVEDNAPYQAGGTRFCASVFGKVALVAATLYVAAASTPSFADTPDTFLEWVESDGTQYIDTEIVGRCNTSADMTIQWLSQPDGSFLSSRLSGNGNGRFILCSNDRNKKYYSGHRTGYWGNQILYNTSGPDRIQTSITHDGTDATITMTINGDEATVTSTEDALDTELNMYLFAQNHGGTVELMSSVRCYSVKIWQDGNLVRDFKPCETNGVAGLYDTVSGRIFLPRTGALASGPVIKLRGKPDHFVQYVEAMGTQYIDTEVVGRCNTAMEAHVLWSVVSDASFLSSRIDGGNTRFVLYGAAGRHYMAHRTYTAATDATGKNSVSGSPRVEWNLEAPDYISSSISTNGANVTYWMKVNGTTRINQTREEEGIDTGFNMYLFAQNKGGSPTLHCPVRCFDVKITQDGTLVRDFRPCIKDGRAGLYDEVSGWIFFPQGGELVYPNETPDKFVKWANAPGANYVPVAVRAKTGVKAEMKFRPTGTTLDQYFLAARKDSGNTRFLLSYLLRKPEPANSWISIGYRNKWCGQGWNEWGQGADYLLQSEINSNGGISGSLTGPYGSSNSAAPTSGEWDTGLNLYMFALNMGGNAQDYYTGRFYYTQIWEWDATANAYRLTRNLKPCVKDGNVMFFDEESQTMFKPYPAIPAKGNVNKNGLTIVVR